MALEREDFTAFMAAFVDHGAFGTDTDLAETLATEFGDLQWASSEGFTDAYLDVLTRRFAGEPDATALEYTFHELCGGLRAGADGAVDALVAWLAQDMRRREWDRYSVPQFDAAAQARYRLSYADDGYQWEDPESPGLWLSEAEFAARRQSSDPEPEPDEEQYSEPVFDENYFMWYRYDYRAAAYRWADGDPDTRPPVDDREQWMTQDEADLRRRYSSPQMDVTAGARYRLNYATGGYEWEDPRSPGRWLSEAEFTALRRPEAENAVPEQFSEPRFDDNYGMWYRYGRNAQAYQYAEGVPETTPDDAAVWMDQAAAEERVLTRAAVSERDTAASGASNADRLLQALGTDVMESALDDVLSAAPHLRAQVGEARLHEILAEVTAEQLALSTR